MFTGAVPKPVIEQINRVVDFSTWGSVFVGCSGSFRFDQAVKQAHPSVKVYSNDVSLLTCSIGELALGRSFSLQFKERLAFVEDEIAGGTFFDRVAAILVALDMAKYTGSNAHAKAHFNHYQNNFSGFHTNAKEKLTTYLERIDIEDFYAGDFQQQVARAAEADGGIVAFPPTYKGGYERLYKFIDENTEWPRPDYGVWDPKNIENWTLELEQAGIRYCVLSDQEFERLPPVTKYVGATNKPVYTYSNCANSSFRKDRHKVKPFRYTPIDAKRIHEGSTVQIIVADAAMMNFLKDKYLSKGIMHVSGMMNFLVLVDGMLVGGFIYQKSKFGEQDTIYCLSDFSISRQRKLSKLIAMLATGRDTIEIIRKRYILPITKIATTAFTNKPVSMKYRGIFELSSRKPGMLNYQSEVRNASAQEIFRNWFKRYGKI